MAMDPAERARRIAELKKQIAANKKREKKDNRSLESLIGKSKSTKKKTKKKVAKKKAKKNKSAEDMVNDLRKTGNRLKKKTGK